MGRLSPEKGQDNLITAFKHHVETNANSRLYILGDGPLKNNLQKLIDQLELQNHVFLVGQVENPFTILKCVIALFYLPIMKGSQWSF